MKRTLSYLKFIHLCTSIYLLYTQFKQSIIQLINISKALNQFTQGLELANSINNKVSFLNNKYI